MKNKVLFALWGSLFILCAALGFIPAPSGICRGLLTALSLVFFLPPGLLLYRAKKQGNTHVRLLIRNLAALSLILTLVLLVSNLMLAFASAAVGNLLHGILVIVSSPMVCSGYWALSLFLWACLLMASLKK